MRTRASPGRTSLILFPTHQRTYVIQARQRPLPCLIFFWLAQPESTGTLSAFSASQRPPRDKPPRDIFGASTADPPTVPVSQQFRVCLTIPCEATVLVGPVNQRTHNLPDSGS